MSTGRLRAKAEVILSVTENDDERATFLLKLFIPLLN